MGRGGSREFLLLAFRPTDDQEPGTSQKNTSPWSAIEAATTQRRVHLTLKVETTVRELTHSSSKRVEAESYGYSESWKTGRD
jgi:hypothetical protein